MSDLTWVLEPVNKSIAQLLRDCPHQPPHFCQCGCGGQALVAVRNRTDRGQRKGDCLPFRNGHSAAHQEIVCHSCRLTRPRRDFDRRDNGRLYQRCRDCRQKVTERYEPPIKRRFGGEARARDEAGRKRCPSCEDWQPEERFSRWSLGLDGLATYCKLCAQRKDRLYKYGISGEEFDKLLRQQNGCCATCLNPFTDEIPPCVDHDHSCCPGIKSCGKCVRGLLCSPCNRGLAAFRDSLESLRGAVKYLESF